MRLLFMEFQILSLFIFRLKNIFIQIFNVKLNNQLSCQKSCHIARNMDYGRVHPKKLKLQGNKRFRKSFTPDLI
jgi:hypothetical protein